MQIYLHSAACKFTYTPQHVNLPTFLSMQIYPHFSTCKFTYTPQHVNLPTFLSIKIYLHSQHVNLPTISKCKFTYTPQRDNTICGTFSLLFTGRRKLFSGDKVLCGTKLNTNLHAIPSLNMSGVKPPVFHKLSRFTQE